MNGSMVWTWRKVLKVAGVTALAICLASAALADRRVALVFGTDRYETLRPLSNAVNDARAIEDQLLALGFEVFSEQNRDLRRMRRALEDFEEDAAGADVAFVFFAGHGVEIDGANMLLPADADPSSAATLKDSSLPLNDVQQIVSRVARTALIVLDACRDDPFSNASAGNGRGAISMSLSDEVRPGLGRMGSSENTLFAFAAAPGETASDGEGDNSPFTTALTKYLGTEGLEIRSVLTLVQQDVYDRTKGRQLPYVESGLPNLFFASETQDELPERERLLLAMADIDDGTRRDVERVARDFDAPLAPLYGALIGSDLGALDRQQRAQKLREAATAFTKVRDQLRLLNSEDDRVTALRQEAEAQLQLGAFGAARQKLNDAAQIDANSRETLRANLVRRTLSEAATHYLNGGAAMAELRYDLAIADHDRAIALFRSVADEEFTPEGRTQQLDTVGQLGQLHITVGNLPSAAIAFRSQLDAARAAIAFDPDNTDFQYTLALAHDSLGDVLFEQGRIADALVHFQDGHAVRLSLAEVNPNDEDIKFALSNSYHRLGQIYHRQGELTLAAGLYADKHALVSGILQTNPDGYRWQKDMALAEERLGDIMKERGQLETALAHYVASLERIVPIRDSTPEDLELVRFTTISLDRIGDVLAQQGKQVEALRSFEESRALRETLVRSDPANADWQYVLGISYERMGDVLRRLGEDDAATEAYKAKHAVVSALSASDPTNVRWLRDLSVADDRLGQMARARGDFDAAKRHLRSSLNRIQAVRDAGTTDLELTRFVSFAQDLLGDVYRDAGDRDTALKLYKDSLELREDLVGIDPQNQDWRFILGVSYERIGRAYLKAGQPDEALEAFRQEVATMQVLLDQDPGNAQWARAVSLSDEWVAKALLANNEPRKALEQYGASLARMSTVRDADPGNSSYQRFTAKTLFRIGEIHATLGETAQALVAFSTSRALLTPLLEDNPQNEQVLRDLWLVAKAAFEAGADPQLIGPGALDTARALADLGGLDPSDENVIQRIEDTLGATAE
ncbi:MAG: caspase family protein [Pseudomonadota bacterium]